MKVEMRKRSFVVTRSFILGVFVTTLMVIASMPDTASAGWFTRKKIVDSGRDLLSSGNASLAVKHSGYTYDYGDSVKGFPDIEVFVICAACGKSSALERTPIFPPLAIRVGAAPSASGNSSGTNIAGPDLGPPSAGNKTSPQEKAVPGLGETGMKEQGVSRVPGEKERTPCVLATIYFKLDSDVVRDSEMKKIRKAVLDQLKDKKDLKVSVKGYTCELGTKEHNDGLANRRAKVVAKVLEEAGIRLTQVSGEGKCCYVSEELHMNRRSEVFVERESAANAGLQCEAPTAGK